MNSFGKRKLLKWQDQEEDTYTDSEQFNKYLKSILLLLGLGGLKLVRKIKKNKRAAVVCSIWGHKLNFEI